MCRRCFSPLKFVQFGERRTLERNHWASMATAAAAAAGREDIRSDVGQVGIGASCCCGSRSDPREEEG